MTAGIAANSEMPSGLGDRRADDNIRAAAVATEFISFAVGDEQYGVNIMAVREIKDWSAITQLPKQPDHMRGVLNLRGVIVPIIDLRCRFGNGLTDATPMHVIIVIQSKAKPSVCWPIACSTSSRSIKRRSSPCPRYRKTRAPDFCPGWSPSTRP
jgi:hypothetical protein